MAIQHNDLHNERFGFTIFVSACAHAIFIFGVGFSYFDQLNNATALDITLAQYRSDIAPDNPDFLAQDNQSGSGTLNEAVAPSTPVESDFYDDQIQDVAPEPSAPEQELVDNGRDDVVTAENADRSTAQDDNPLTQDPLQPPGEQLNTQELNLAIASLQAQLDLQRQEYANRPRRYTISSASTKKSHDALYLDSWRKRIEAIGNLNYPEAARAQRLYGSLRLLIVIQPEGDVSEIRVLQSSGYSILDQAAVDIINLSAPFEPLPSEIRQEADILEIIRTFRFHEGDSLTSN